MPQIPKKRVVTLDFVLENPSVPAFTAVVIPESQHYTGFMVQCIGIEPGIDIEASLNGTDWARLSSDNFFLAPSPHMKKTTILSIALHAPCAGGLRIVSAKEITEIDPEPHADMTTGGKVVVAMFERAYPDTGY